MDEGVRRAEQPILANRQCCIDHGTALSRLLSSIRGVWEAREVQALSDDLKVKLVDILERELGLDRRCEKITVSKQDMTKQINKARRY